MPALIGQFRSRYLYFSLRLGLRLYSLPIAVLFALPVIARGLRDNIADSLVVMR